MPALTEKTLNGVTYWEMTIGAVQATTPIALALHWMTGDSAAMTFLFAQYTQPLRTIFLQGRHPSGHELGGYSWFPGELGFYDLSEADQAPAIREEAGYIALFLNALKSAYAAPIAVTGMSQGGDLTLALAAYHPDTFDLAIPCAGRLSPAMRPDPFAYPADVLPKVFMKQGADDPIVSVDSAKEVAAWLAASAFTVSLQVYEHTAHEIPEVAIEDIHQHLTGLYTL